MTPQSPPVSRPTAHPLQRRWPRPLFYWLVYPLFWILVHLVARVQVRGSHSLPRSGGVLLISNHLSLFDPMLITTSLRRPTYFMAKSELSHLPLISWIIGQLNTFYVRRGAVDREALRQCEAFLDDGAVLVIFPEGTRSRDGHLQNAQEGVAFLARRRAVPIVPVALTGSEQVNVLRIWRRPRVTVTVGEAFWMRDLPDLHDRHAQALAIMQRLAALLPAAYQPVDQPLSGRSGE